MLPTRGLPSPDVQLRPFHLTKSSVMDILSTSWTSQTPQKLSKHHLDQTLVIHPSPWASQNRESPGTEMQAASLSRQSQTSRQPSWSFRQAASDGTGQRSLVAEEVMVCFKIPVLFPPQKKGSIKRIHIHNINYTHPKKTTATIFVIKKTCWCLIAVMFGWIVGFHAFPFQGSWFQLVSPPVNWNHEMIENDWDLPKTWYPEDNPKQVPSHSGSVLNIKHHPNLHQPNLLKSLKWHAA